MKIEIRKVLKETGKIITRTYNEWVDDRAFKMAAALSFYSLISLVPIIVIITAVTGAILGNDAASGELVSSIEGYVGIETATLIQKLVINATIPGSDFLAYMVSIIVFIWASAGIFVELKDSLNLIWGVEIKPGKGLKVFFVSRMFSFVLLLVMGLLFVLSLFAGMILKVLGNYLNDIVVIPSLFYWLDVIISFTLVTALFALVIKYLPSVKVEWKYVMVGAVTTSVLFNIGNYAISYYLSNAYYSSVYGAAGSLALLLLWIFYSGLIFFFGAELTQVIRNEYSPKDLKISKNVLKISKVTEQVHDNTS